MRLTWCYAHGSICPYVETSGRMVEYARILVNSRPGNEEGHHTRHHCVRSALVPAHVDDHAWNLLFEEIGQSAPNFLFRIDREKGRQLVFDLDVAEVTRKHSGFYRAREEELTWEIQFLIRGFRLFRSERHAPLRGFATLPEGHFHGRSCFGPHQPFFLLDFLSLAGCRRIRAPNHFDIPRACRMGRPSQVTISAPNSIPTRAALPPGAIRQAATRPSSSVTRSRPNHPSVSSEASPKSSPPIPTCPSGIRQMKLRKAL